MKNHFWAMKTKQWIFYLHWTDYLLYGNCTVIRNQCTNHSDIKAIRTFVLWRNQYWKIGQVPFLSHAISAFLGQFPDTFFKVFALYAFIQRIYLIFDKHQSHIKEIAQNTSIYEKYYDDTPKIINFFFTFKFEHFVEFYW